MHAVLDDICIGAERVPGTFEPCACSHLVHGLSIFDLECGPVIFLVIFSIAFSL